MATSSEYQLLDIMTCPICLEKLKIPKSLPCLHTFCQSCLEIFISTRFERGNKRGIECPLCNANVPVPKENCSPSEFVNKLPLNFLINGLMEERKVLRPDKQCMMCDRLDIRSDASFICVECNDLLCLRCTKHHRVSKSSSNHEIKPLEDVQTEEQSFQIFKSTCSEHKNKELELYCVDHEDPCCSTCVCIYHRKCEKVLSLEEAAKGYKKSNNLTDIKDKFKSLKSDVENVILDRQSVLQSVDTQTKDLSNMIDTEFDKLIKQLNVVKKRRKAELDKLSAEAKDRIQTTLTIFENQKKNIENEENNLYSYIEKAPEAQLVIEVKHLKLQLKEHESLINKYSDDIVENKLSLKNIDMVSLKDLLEQTYQPMIEKPKHSLVLNCYNNDQTDLLSCFKPDKSGLLSFCRFNSVQRFQWTIRGEVDAICFHVSKDIELCGILSYGCKDGLSTFKIKVSIKDGATDLISHSDTLDSRLAENNLFKILFPETITLTAYKPYNALLVMKGPPCNAGEKGNQLVKCGPVSFSFEHSKYCKNGTSVRGGQIPGFLFKIASNK